MNSDATEAAFVCLTVRENGTAYHIVSGEDGDFSTYTCTVVP